MSGFVSELSRVLLPLRHLDDPARLDRLLETLGFTEVARATTDVVTLFTSVVDTVTDLTEDLADTIEGLADTSDPVELIAQIGRLIDTIRSLGAVDAWGADEIGSLAGDLLSFLTTEWLEAFHPALDSLLRGLGIVDGELSSDAADVSIGGAQLRLPPYLERVRFDRLQLWLTNPGLTLRRRLSALVPSEVLAILANAATAAGVDAIWDLGLVGDQLVLDPVAAPDVRSDEALALAAELGDSAPIGLLGVFAILANNSTASRPVDGFYLATAASATGHLEIGTNWVLEVSAGTITPTGFAWSASGGLIHSDPGAGLSLGFSRAEDAPDLILGAPDGLHVAADAVSLDVFGQATAGDADFGIGFATRRVRIQIVGGDSFLGEVAGQEIGLEFDFALGWSRANGFMIAGSGGGCIDLGSASIASLLDVSGMRLCIQVGGDAGAILGAAFVANLRANIGPIKAVVEDVGLGLALGTGIEDPDFDFGNVGLELAFKPPTGLGISIDAGTVKGGGFIRYDEPRGRYSGMLQLKVFNVSVTAIGLLDTKDSQGNPLPDPGFSFLVIISVEFPPIQLGFGFTLSGIGGLLGIYRDSDYEALRAGLTTGALDSVMFPEDPVANADKIISDLSTLFPTKADSYIIGPMLLLGWGTPTLIRIEVGVLIIFGGPVRVQILGQLSTELPSSDAALIKLNIDVIGEIDFGQGTLKIDATLRDSSLVGFPLTGDLVARARWKDDPMFGLAFGGFHPDYRPHAAFPKDIKRLALSIAEGSNLRIGAESYLAVTSNSVQFGARAELYAAAAGFSVKGDFEIHLLIIFDPFGFKAGVRMRVSLRFKGKSFASLGLEFELSGPRPWRAKGKLKIKILLVTFKLGFNVSWGSSTPMLGPPLDVWAALKEALEFDENWAAVLPARSALDVLLLPRAEPNKVIVHPHGRLEMRQRVVPFDVPLDRFGNGRPAGDNLFEAPEVLLAGSPPVEPPYLEDYFASGEYKDLAEDEKLSAPSFELMKSGLVFGSDAVKTGSAAAPNTDYENKIVGPEREKRDGDPALDSLVLAAANLVTLNRMAQAEEVRVSSLTASRYTELGREPAISVKPERVAVIDDATGESGTVAAPSWVNGREFLRRVQDEPAYRNLRLSLLNASERP